MCMLSYYPDNVLPDASELWNGADHNPDGHGWASVDARNRHIRMRKSMSADEAISTFVEERKRDASGPALFHSRIATSGLVDVTGVHPFQVGSDRRTVVGHNGILFNPGRDSTKSDTRIFAERMLPRFGSLDSAKKMHKLEKFCGLGNKLVILTVNPSRRRHGYIVNEEMGSWSNTSGAWHSNHDYLWSGPKYTYGSSYGRYSNLWEPDEDYSPTARFDEYQRDAKDAPPWETKPDIHVSPWPCEVCGALDSVSKFTLICDVCRSCQDCYSFAEECQCFVPESQRTKSAAESARDFVLNYNVREIKSSSELTKIDR